MSVPPPPSGKEGANSRREREGEGDAAAHPPGAAPFLAAPVEPRTLDPWLLAKLVCPLTRRPLRYDEDACELVSEAAGLAYPVRDGLPVLLAEDARRLA